MSDIKYKIFIFIIASIYIGLIWQDIKLYWLDINKSKE
jgi:hypothetical protein